MRVKNKKEYYVRPKSNEKDSKGNVKDTYCDAVMILANIYPATSKVQAEIYGERINEIMNMLYDCDVDIKKGDGICVYVSGEEQPDYKVNINPKKYTSHSLYELKKL